MSTTEKDMKKKAGINSDAVSAPGNGMGPRIRRIARRVKGPEEIRDFWSDVGRDVSKTVRREFKETKRAVNRAVSDVKERIEIFKSAGRGGRR